MDYNYTVWDYYQPNFVDPEFAPYMRTPVMDQWGNTIMTNTWESIQNPNGLINPELIRKNWGLRFALLHPDDPCPAGFYKTPDGYCHRTPEQYEPILYTDKAFIPKNQYWSGYAKTNTGSRRVSDTFDMRSVNPLTGAYTVYYLPKPSKSEGKYGVFPTKDSYSG
jgi:hypothetical protein